MSKEEIKMNVAKVLRNWYDMKTVWGKIKDFLGGSSRKFSGAHAPVLIRVVDEDGRSVPEVHVEATFSPSGRTVQGRRVTAQGLCLFPWGRNETKVEVVVRAGQVEASTSVDRAASDRSRQIVLEGVSSNAEDMAPANPLPAF